MFDAVLFDCDGVLVDSEPITNGVLREVLNEAGWALTQAECQAIFIGKAVRDECARIDQSQAGRSGSGRAGIDVASTTTRRQSSGGSASDLPRVG